MTEDYYDIENYLKDMEVTGIFLPRKPRYSEYNYSNLYSDDDASGDTSEAETDDDDDSSERMAIGDAITAFEFIFNGVVSIFPAAGDEEPACLKPLHHPSEIPSNRDYDGGPNHDGGVLKNAVKYFLEWPLQSHSKGLSQRKYKAALEKWRFDMHAACADFGFQTYLQNAMESAVPVPADKQRKNYEYLCHYVEDLDMDKRYVDTTRVLSLLKPLEKPATIRDFVDVLIPLAEIVLKGKRMTASNKGQFLPYFFIKDCIGLFKDFVNERRPAWAAVGADAGAGTGARGGSYGVSRGDEDKSGKGGRRMIDRRLYRSRSRSKSQKRGRSSRHRHHTNKKCSIM
jgi:hypothetical protein